MKWFFFSLSYMARILINLQVGTLSLRGAWRRGLRPDERAQCCPEKGIGMSQLPPPLLIPGSTPLVGGWVCTTAGGCKGELDSLGPLC